MRGLTTDQWIVWIASCAFLIVATGCTSTRYVTKQAHHENAFLGVTNPVWYSPSQPELSERTQSLLVRYDLLKQYKSSPEDALIKLQTQDLKNPQQLYAIAELAYLQGYKARKSGRKGLALQHYGTALMASYRYLLGPELADQRNVFDPQFRRAADLYNEALEDSLRLMSAELKENNEFLRPGESYDLSNGAHKLKMRVLTQGTARQKWRSEDFGGFEFVSDYRIEQLRNRHTTYGLGVPLIVVNQRSQSNEQVCKYYPEGLSFAVTALVRCPPKQQLPAGEDPALIGEAGPRPDLATSVSPNANEITLELYDPLSENEVRLHERWVPLQTDISTPLAFFLDSEQFRKKNMPTEGLLRPDSRQEARGLFMLEPYDPNRIPVLMVHGLWSSPLTWMDMFNDLRSFPEIRERYQFWFYLYPTGQPFWISAVQLRTDLQDMQRQLDPESRNTQLNQMVLVGHSMGGWSADYKRSIAEMTFGRS